MQLALFSESNKQKTIRKVPLADLAHSRFNTRKTRTPERVKALAERMSRNGFEITRAPWAYGEDGCMAVFAGGTRLEAARMAGLDEIPVVVHEGFGPEEIATLADLDNENDEYHEKVSLLDVWAEFARLHDEEGWTYEQIGVAKGCSEGRAITRAKLHRELPDAARKATSDGTFEEGHCEALFAVTSDVGGLAPWLTTEQAQTELTAEVLAKHRGSSVGKKPTVANIREAAARWKEMIRLTETLYAETDPEYQEAFVISLCGTLQNHFQPARNLGVIRTIHSTILREREDDLREAQEELRRQQSAAEAERVRVEREARRAERVTAYTSRVVLGDAAEQMENAPKGFRLLLTDPPYGTNTQSQRRVVTAKKDLLANDDEAIFRLLPDVLRTAYALMADDAHALIFTAWKHQERFRQIATEAGFTVQDACLIWVKGNHGTGDLKDFAPRHELILHAVKGKPEVSPRRDDVLMSKDQQNSDHPTEKPQALLRTLIECTTRPADVVVDPFAGSGATLFAAMDAERDFWGCEIDAAWHAKISDEIYRRACRLLGDD